MQVGRRPSSPWLLLVISVMWLAAGIYLLFELHRSWKLIAGIAFIGIGLLYLRGAAATLLRRVR